MIRKDAIKLAATTIGAQPIISANGFISRDLFESCDRKSNFYLPECNGRIAVVGLCYGGPYALLGPARLGCDAGFSFHGTAVENYLGELSNVGEVPIRLHWGDQDRVCPPDTLARIQAATDAMANVEITVYPGVSHGYTAASNAKSWNAAAAENSWASALAVLDGLRNALRAAQA